MGVYYDIKYKKNKRWYTLATVKNIQIPGDPLPLDDFDIRKKILDELIEESESFLILSEKPLQELTLDEIHYILDIYKKAIRLIDFTFFDFIIFWFLEYLKNLDEIEDYKIERVK